MPVEVIGAERGDDDDAWGDFEVLALEARDFKNEPTRRGVDGGVVGWLADVAEALGAFAEARKEKGHERGGR